MICRVLPLAVAAPELEELLELEEPKVPSSGYSMSFERKYTGTHGPPPRPPPEGEEEPEDEEREEELELDDAGAQQEMYWYWRTMIGTPAVPCWTSSPER